MPLSRFDIAAAADPQALVRLLNNFAQLDLLPQRVRAVTDGGSVKIRIELPGLAEREARIIAEKMRSSVLVKSVSARRGRHLLVPFSETIDDLPEQ